MDSGSYSADSSTEEESTDEDDRDQKNEDPEEGEVEDSDSSASEPNEPSVSVGMMFPARVGDITLALCTEITNRRPLVFHMEDGVQETYEDEFIELTQELRRKVFHRPVAGSVDYGRFSRNGGHFTRDGIFISQELRRKIWELNNEYSQEYVRQMDERFQSPTRTNEEGRLVRFEEPRQTAEPLLPEPQEPVIARPPTPNPVTQANRVGAQPRQGTSARNNRTSGRSGN